MGSLKVEVNAYVVRQIFHLQFFRKLFAKNQYFLFAWYCDLNSLMIRTGSPYIFLKRGYVNAMVMEWLVIVNTMCNANATMGLEMLAMNAKVCQKINS